MTRAQVQSGNVNKDRKRKRPIEDAPEPGAGPPAPTPGRQPGEETPPHTDEQADPVAFWVSQGRWPEDLRPIGTTSQADPTRLRKEALYILPRKRSSSARSSVPSDQSSQGHRRVLPAPHQCVRHYLARWEGQVDGVVIAL